MPKELAPVMDAQSARSYQAYERYSGDYSGCAMLYPDSAGDRPEHHAAKVEGFYGHHIDKLLAQADGRRTIWMEIGSAASVSLMRIAKRNKLAVQSGSLVLVGTNLNMPRTYFIEMLHGEAGEEAADLQSEVGSMVHELLTDFMPGQQYVVESTDGTVIDLTGQVDVASERLSLTAWGKHLNVQIAELGKLLSPRSLYMVPFRDIWFEQPGGKRREWPKSVDLDKVHRNLMSDRGLRAVAECEVGAYAGRTLRYLVFKAGDTPDIHIADEAEDTALAALAPQ